MFCQIGAQFARRRRAARLSVRSPDNVFRHPAYPQPDL